MAAKQGTLCRDGHNDTIPSSYCVQPAPGQLQLDLSFIHQYRPVPPSYWQRAYFLRNKHYREITTDTMHYVSKESDPYGFDTVVGKWEVKPELRDQHRKFEEARDKLLYEYCANLEQGTEEWLALRRFVLSASVIKQVFPDLKRPNKGKTEPYDIMDPMNNPLTDAISRTNFVQSLESYVRYDDVAHDYFAKQAMQKGSDNEPYLRVIHINLFTTKLLTQREAEQVHRDNPDGFGYVTKDTHPLGADGHLTWSPLDNLLSAVDLSDEALMQLDRNRMLLYFIPDVMLLVNMDGKNNMVEQKIPLYVKLAPANVERERRRYRTMHPGIWNKNFVERQYCFYGKCKCRGHPLDKHGRVMGHVLIENRPSRVSDQMGSILHDVLTSLSMSPDIARNVTGYDGINRIVLGELKYYQWLANLNKNKHIHAPLTEALQKWNGMSDTFRGLYKAHEYDAQVTVQQMNRRAHLSYLDWSSDYFGVMQYHAPDPVYMESVFQAALFITKHLIRQEGVRFIYESYAGIVVDKEGRPALVDYVQRGNSTISTRYALLSETVGQAGYKKIYNVDHVPNKLLSDRRVRCNVVFVAPVPMEDRVSVPQKKRRQLPQRKPIYPNSNIFDLTAEDEARIERIEAQRKADAEQRVLADVDANNIWIMVDDAVPSTVQASSTVTEVRMDLNSPPRSVIEDDESMLIDEEETQPPEGLIGLDTSKMTVPNPSTRLAVGQRRSNVVSGDKIEWVDEDDPGERFLRAPANWNVYRGRGRGRGK